MITATPRQQGRALRPPYYHSTQALIRWRCCSRPPTGASASGPRPAPAAPATGGAKGPGPGLLLPAQPLPAAASSCRCFARLERGAGAFRGSLRPPRAVRLSQAGSAAREPPLAPQPPGRGAPRTGARDLAPRRTRQGRPDRVAAPGERPGPARGAARPARPPPPPRFVARSPRAGGPAGAPPCRARQEGRGLWSDGSEQAGAELPFHRSRH